MVVFFFFFIHGANFKCQAFIVQNLPTYICLKSCWLLVAELYILFPAVLSLGSSIDVYKAHQSISEVINTIKSVRDDMQLFNKLYHDMEEMTTLERPRTTGRQTLRANYDVDDLQQYLRVAYFLPYVDTLLADLTRRFASSPLLTSGKPHTVINVNSAFDMICQTIYTPYTLPNSRVQVALSNR